MTTAIVLATSGNQAADRLLPKALREWGYTLLSLDEADKVEAEVCVYFTLGSLTAPQVADVLKHGNTARQLVAVTTSISAVLPGDLTISIDVPNSHLAWANVAQRITSFKSVQQRPTSIPYLVDVPEEYPGQQFVAMSPDELYKLLQNPAARFIGVSQPTLRTIESRLPQTRRDYDLARYVRWSKQRLDQSFVRIGLSLVGGDSPNAVVSHQPSSLNEVIGDPRATRLIVIQGAPGSGKSFQLKYLETVTALRSIRTGSDDSVPMVFCINLGDLATASLSFDPMAWVRERWRRRVREEWFGTLTQRLANGKNIILLDGFNEIPFSHSADRTNWMRKWKSAIHEELLIHQATVVVVASRTRDLQIQLGNDETAATDVTMAPLELEEILAIAQRINPRAADQLRGQFAVDPTLVELYRTPFTLIDQLRYSSSEVPQNQSELFWRRIAGALLRERDGARNALLADKEWISPPAVDDLVSATTLSEAIGLLETIPFFRALGSLATSMMKRAKGATQHVTNMTSTEAIQLLGEGLGASRDIASEALKLAVDLELLSHHDGIVRFDHQTLQDFFAAIQISDDDLVEAVRLTTADFAERLGGADEALTQTGPSEVIPLMPATGFEEVLARALELRPGVAVAAALSNPWLVAERLPFLHLADDVREQVSRRVVETLTAEPMHGDFRKRASDLFALGRIGWSYAEQDLGLTVEVPGGGWRLGSSDDTFELLGSSFPSRDVELRDFSIGRFPVTNREYREFIEDDGYRQQRFWSAEGWQWRAGAIPVEMMLERWERRRAAVAAEPEMPFELLESGRISILEAAAIIRFSEMTDQELYTVAVALVGQEVSQPAFWNVERYTADLQPVVGICFHEATAYCSWLSERLRRSVRLPTEDEWEAAAWYARGLMPGVVSAQQAKPPFEWSPEWGNTAELRIGRPSPVGCFGEIATEIPVDISGNAFEWVIDPVNAGNYSARVVKGGSWRHLMRRAHPAYRGRGDLSTRNDDNGFRVILS